MTLLLAIDYLDQIATLPFLSSMPFRHANFASKIPEAAQNDFLDSKDDILALG
jgi:hypothetical protein